MSDKLPFSTRVKPQVVANTFRIVHKLTGVRPDSRSDVFRSALMILEKAAGHKVDLFNSREEALRFLAEEGLNLPDKAFKNLPEDNELQQSLDFDEVDLEERERSVGEEAFLQSHQEKKKQDALEQELEEIFEQAEEDND